MAPAAPHVAPHDRHHPGCGCAQPAPASARPWLAPLGVGAAALVGCVAIGLYNPTDGGAVICPFRAVTGLDCPGCGMTRGLSHLVRGHAGTAVDYNLALVVAVPAIAYLYLAWLAGAFGYRLPALQLHRTGLVIAGALFLAFSVLRNLPIGIGRYLNSSPSA